MKVNSTDSSLSGEESLYHSDAKGASCLLLQQKVIATQALNVEKYLKEGVLVQQKHCIESVESNPQDILPKVLSNRMEDSGNGRRNGESENGNEGGGEKSKKEERVMDDVEVSIMGILDSDGNAITFDVSQLAALSEESIHYEYEDIVLIDGAEVPVEINSAGDSSLPEATELEEYNSN